MILERQIPLTINNFATVLQHEAILNRAQTYAFTVLGLSLIHIWQALHPEEALMIRTVMTGEMCIIGMFGMEESP